MTMRPDRLGDIAQIASNAAAQNSVTEFEGQIREFVRRDGSGRRRPQPLPEPAQHNPDGMNALVERVAGASVNEIDRVIAELQEMRAALCREGERVQRELSGFAGLSQTAMESMKIIADSLSQLRPSMIAPRSDAG